MLLANAAPLRSMSASAGGVHFCIIAPLSPMARANFWRDSGDTISALTDSEPADSPPMVICAGSPPKAVMLRRTQSSAAT